MVIEHKTPGLLGKKSELSNAKDQLEEYLIEEAGDVSKLGLIRILLDGQTVAFVRYTPRGWEEEVRCDSIKGLLLNLFSAQGTEAESNQSGEPGERFRPKE